jgi:hypothetical protein
VVTQRYPIGAVRNPPGSPGMDPRRCVELLGAIQDFQQAITAPVGELDWPEQVGSRLSALREAFTAHVRATEGPDGLYAELVETAPRLAGAVQRLTREHATITAALSGLNVGFDTGGPFVARATDLLHKLFRHRQLGADLVHEAYVSDIGGET